MEGGFSMLGSAEVEKLNHMLLAMFAPQPPDWRVRLSFRL